MKKIILGILALLIMKLSFGQETETLDYCDCQDKIEQITPNLNGAFERKCNDILIEKGAFINGLKNGDWITHSRKGAVIRSLKYNKGLLDGDVSLFYNNGKPKLSGQFKNGNKIGKWTYYTKKGKVLSTGSYEMNKPIGNWIIKDKKAKKTVVQYDFNAKKYILNNTAPAHKGGAVIQNDNTTEWYIYIWPDRKYSSKSEPLGGYAFANYMFTEFVEIPETLWDTYIYKKYKVAYEITSDNKVSFESQSFTASLPDEHIEMTFLVKTNQKSKINKVNPSNLQIKLLDYKINEALSLMPPWIYNEQANVDVYLHYVINKNLHK